MKKNQSWWHWPAIFLAVVALIYVVLFGPANALMAKAGPWSNARTTFNWLTRPHVHAAYYSENYYNYLHWWLRIAKVEHQHMEHASWKLMIAADI